MGAHYLVGKALEGKGFFIGIMALTQVKAECVPNLIMHSLEGFTKCKNCGCAMRSSKSRLYDFHKAHGECKWALQKL
jgi:hypothetical protein